MALKAHMVVQIRNTQDNLCMLHAVALQLHKWQRKAENKDFNYSAWTKLQANVTNPLKKAAYRLYTEIYGGGNPANVLEHKNERLTFPRDAITIANYVRYPIGIVGMGARGKMTVLFDTNNCAPLPEARRSVINRQRQSWSGCNG